MPSSGDEPTVAWFSYVPTEPSFDDYGSGWGAPGSNVYYSYAVNDSRGSLVRGDNRAMRLVRSSSTCKGKSGTGSGSGWPINGLLSLKSTSDAQGGVPMMGVVLLCTSY